MPAAFDQHVEPAQSLDRSADLFANRLFAGDVDLHRGQAIGVACVLRGVQRLFEAGLGNVGGDDGATFCQDAGNGGLADSGSCAADEDALVVESIHEKTPVCGMDSCLVTDSARSRAINLLGIPLTGHQWCLFARNPERTSTDVS